MDRQSSFSFSRARTNQDVNSSAVIEVTGFPSPEKCHRCLLSNHPCWISSNLNLRCSYCTRMHVSCSLVSNKQFDTACEQFRSLAGEISCARQLLQADIIRLNDLERRWEHFVEHGFPQVRFIIAD
jgi:hypothetical protein